MQQYTWFYSFEKPFSESIEKELSSAFTQFLQNWKSHGKDIYGSIRIAHRQFVIIQTDDNKERPSGCSIDSMKSATERILQGAGLDWTDAGRIFFRTSSGEIGSTDFRELDKLIQIGTLHADTIVFDHSLGQTDDLSRWEIPLKESWMARFLPETARS
jgi:hypothetical protein